MKKVESWRLLELWPGVKISEIWAILAGVFKDFCFAQNFGKWSNFRCICFKWVEAATEIFLDFLQGDYCYLSTGSIVKTHRHVESPCEANSCATCSKHLHQIQVLIIINDFILGEKITIVHLRRDLYSPPLFKFIWQRSPPSRACVFLETQSCKYRGNATTEPSLGHKNSLDGFLYQHTWWPSHRYATCQALYSLQGGPLPLKR